MLDARAIAAELIPFGQMTLLKEIVIDEMADNIFRELAEACRAAALDVQEKLGAATVSVPRTAIVLT